MLVPPDVAAHVAQRHIETKEHLGKICAVLEAPDSVYYRQRTDSYFFYRIGVLSGKLARNFMVVIVKYSGETGVVRTTYSTGRPATGDHLMYARRGG